MTIRLDRIDLYQIPLRTRFPFRCGIAELTEAPHLIVQATAEVNGNTATGLAADLLPPKWFTKIPDTHFDDDAREMRAVIRQAGDTAIGLGACESVFDLWRRLYDAQSRWAKQTPHPPLLWHFGVSLIERAAIDAYCRALDAGLHESHGLRTKAPDRLIIRTPSPVQTGEAQLRTIASTPSNRGRSPVL